ncbi:MAG: helix-turn-helix domain-containing protein [Atopobiaceae bacterium]|nr:helix-turn-helix domain-containing protein [Atopobiaceae bacterium]
MSERVIAAVSVATNKLVVWFDGGTSRIYLAQDLGIGNDQDFDAFEISPDNTRIAWPEGISFDAETLSSMGEEVDIVNNEKMRLLKSLSRIRRNKSFSQTRLGEAAGIRQSVISRIEGCEISPQINTLIKLLAPLGKTLAIVDLKES